MTFEEFWNIPRTADEVQPKALSKAAFMAGADAAKNMPLRVMFDQGVQRGRTDTAEGIITLIMEWEGSWSVMDFRDAIKEKYGLVIKGHV